MCVWWCKVLYVLHSCGLSHIVQFPSILGDSIYQKFKFWSGTLSSLLYLLCDYVYACVYCSVEADVSGLVYQVVLDVLTFCLTHPFKRVMCSLGFGWGGRLLYGSLYRVVNAAKEWSVV